MSRLAQGQFVWAASLPDLETCWADFSRQAPPELLDPCYRPGFLNWNRWIEGETPGAIYFTCETGAVWYPFHLRDLPAQWEVSGRDITSPYGFGGPLVTGNPEEQPITLKAFFEHWEAFCHQHQVVAELIRFHPLLENERHLEAYYQVNPAKEVVWVDLTLSPETLWAQLHPQKRRYLKKSEALGLHFSEEKAFFSAFKTLYQASMLEKEAKAFYHFPNAFYHQVHQDLSHTDIWLHSIVHQQTVISSALFLASGKTVYYFLGANAPQAKALHSSPYLMWQTFLKAKALGYEKLLLGGGLAHHDSLYQFKRQLSPDVAPYQIGTRIYDPKRYAALRQSMLAKNPKPEIPEGYLFFYRNIPIAWK